jgi:signal transduction histidine kinase
MPPSPGSEDHVDPEPEAQEAFIQLAAHELRTPLTVLHGMLQLVLDRGRITETRCRPLIAAAYAETRRMQAIIEDLTDVTRLRQGELALEPRQTDLNEVAGAAGAELQGSLAGQRMEVIRHTAPVRVLGDPSRLRQAVRNVVIHVAERAPSQDTIVLQVLPLRRQGCLRIESRGPSLRRPPTGAEMRAHRQPAAVSAAPQGLRLYIAQQVLRLHGGQLSVKAEPDAWLSVLLSLPLLDAAKR